MRLTNSPGIWPLLVSFATLVQVACGVAVPPDAKTNVPDYSPAIHAASGEGAAAIGRFQFDKSLKVELWASEPMVANPVSFCFDGKGRCFVAETFRMKAGVTDNRDHNWLEDDLACRTVADRVKMYQRHAKGTFAQTYERERDRVRVLVDSTGSGKADNSFVVSDDFGKPEDGIAAGVLATNGYVFVTDIPSLYRLRFNEKTGAAETKEALSTGFGVHVSFFGHDLHGLRMGPDGRLYFSCGDRGFHVTTKEGSVLSYPDTGAVLRCEPDGSRLEVVHIGLRNPQELAFDDFGNLFTVDNNSDSGDKARFVQIVEGGDSGWRIGYQYGTSMHDSTVKQGNRGPWNYEKFWLPPHEGQPAYIVPALTNFSDGPSGLCHYPGVGLSEDFNGHFFVCDFRGNSSGSGVWSFTTKPKGAGFELINPRHFVWNVLATDCDFGPDCAFYISDWTEGWNKTGKGRLYKVTDPAAQKNPAAADAKKLLAEGFQQRSIKALIDLLSHPHQQVRLEAQFELATRGNDTIAPLLEVAKSGTNHLARIHAIWGLGQIVRRVDLANGRGVAGTVEESFCEYSKDPDAEIRAQIARAMGSGFSDASRRRLVEMLADPAPRVRFLAAQSLASQISENVWKAYPQTTRDEMRSAVVKLLRDNGDQDPYLRHAGSRALAAMRGEETRTDMSSAVRLAHVVAIRHALRDRPSSQFDLKSEEIVPLLRDPDPKIVSETARLIDDLNLSVGIDALADMQSKPNMPIDVLYRSLNANFRRGRPENAAALADFATRVEAPAHLRALALQMLGSWPNPPRRDFISGLTQNLPAREAAAAAAAMKSKLASIFAGPAVVQKEAAIVAGKLGISEVGPFLLALVNDPRAQSGTRIEAIQALEGINDKRLSDAVATAIASDDPRLRNAGRAVLLKTKPTDVGRQLKDVLSGDNMVEKQGAFALLAELKTADGDEQIANWLERIGKNNVPAELHLDILEAASKRGTARLRSLTKTYDRSRPKDDELSAWRETLVGGDPARGREIFLNKATVSCQRCHKLDGEGGEVGPPLNGLAAKQKREYLLEAIVLPNKQIAKGYESVLILKADGMTVSGVLKFEDAKEVRLMTAEGTLIAIKKDDIEERRATKTAMPEDLVQKLTKRELRDLVEFLAGLKDEWKK